MSSRYFFQVQRPKDSSIPPIITKLKLETMETFTPFTIEKYQNNVNTVAFPRGGLTSLILEQIKGLIWFKKIKSGLQSQNCAFALLQNCFAC